MRCRRKPIRGNAKIFDPVNPPPYVEVVRSTEAHGGGIVYALDTGLGRWKQVIESGWYIIEWDDGGRCGYSREEFIEQFEMEAVG